MLMIPRGIPDIGWLDLLAGFWYCALPGHPAGAQSQVEAAWADHSLACLSVRSGFDVTLQTLAFPSGSEVLVSALTIRDMPRILEHHGLIPIPIDVNPRTLAINADYLHQAINPRTKAILVAHLFGSRMPLDEVTQAARQHGLFVFEDCAQAYDGLDYRGHPASDVSMFSFGPIKTQTALGGALLRFKDPLLLAQVRQCQATCPRQHRRLFLRRLAIFTAFRLMASPPILEVFVRLCRWRGLDYDRVLSSASRAFPGPEFITRIRHQPCTPLLRLLTRRLTRPNPAQVERRADRVRRVLTYLPHINRPGAQAAYHTHWVLPVLTDRPDQLVEFFNQHGFDVTRTASSLNAVLPPDTSPNHQPTQAIEMMKQLVYLPMYPLSVGDMQRLGRLMADFEAANAADV
jgi:perosamine synthetase